MTTKFVYLFANGKADGRGDMKDLLGGKGAGLAEMTNASLPVPPGFTITTEACNAYYAAGEQFPEGLWKQVKDGLAEIERASGKRLGDAANPLLVSVRSGAKFSMPGMMDTVLNLGLNDETVLGIARLTSNERFAFDAYRRFIQMFGKIVLGIDGEIFEHALTTAKKNAKAALDTDLNAAQLKEVCDSFKQIVLDQTEAAFPTDPKQQLDEAVKAVFRSWNGDRAKAYRRKEKIPDDLGTAVNVVTMVFGNLGNDSGTGVAFTRNPATGEKKLFGDYLANAQGEDVVAGIRTPKHIEELNQDMPEIFTQLLEVADKGEPVILVRRVTSPEDVRGMDAAQAILTSTGGATSHAAVVARGWGKPCVAGAGEILIDYERDQFSVNGTRISRGDWLTLDGTSGRVIEGQAPLVDPELGSDFNKLMQWADNSRTLGVRANADTPGDASVARSFGAEGIGLCRTEHMFFEGDRIDQVRQVILG